MSVRDVFLYDLSSKVMCEFCEIMDTLSDLDWTRFGESQPARDAALTGGETGGRWWGGDMCLLWVKIKPLQHTNSIYQNCCNCPHLSVL